MTEEEGVSEIACIYCPPEAPVCFAMGRGSLEHVILAALGGQKGTRNLCCRDCNTRLGSDIDVSFAETFAPLGNLFGIKRDRKGTAPTLSSDQTLDGAALVVAPGGKFQLKKASIVESTTEEGHTALAVHANTLDEADRLRENYSRRFTGPYESQTQYEVISTPAPVLEFSLAIDGPGKRCATKMLLSLLATCVNPDRIRSGEFSDAIAYITGELELGKRVEPWLNMQTPDVPSEFRFGHVALVAASSETGKVVGVLTLYGTFHVTVLLSDAWSGPSLGNRYCIDPCTGQSLTETFDSEAYLQTYPQRGRPDNAEFKAAMDTMVEEIHRRHRSDQFMDMLRQVRAGLPVNASDEQINEAISKAANRMAHEVLRLPYRAPIEKQTPE